MKCDLKQEYKDKGLEIPVAKMGRLFESFIKTFNPEAMGKFARQAGADIAHNFFELAHKDLRYWENGKERRIFWQKQGQGAGMNFIKLMESGRPLGNPVLETMRRGYRTWTKQILEQDHKTWASVGKELPYSPREHYVPHYFEEMDDVIRHFETKYGTKWADPRFTKERAFDFYQEAIDAGFTPKFTNPEELMQMRQHASDVAAMRTDIFRDFEKTGVAQRAKEGSTRPPEGFAGQTYRSPTGVRYWVRDEAVPLIKNALDSKSLWEMQGVSGDAFRGYMALKNKVVPIKLAASLFHPMHVMHIDAVADMTRATKRFAGGQGNAVARLGRFVVDMATSMPYTPGGLVKSGWTNWRTGSPLLRVFQGKLKMEELSDAQRQAFHDLAESGMVPTRPMQETANEVQKLKDAWYGKSMLSAAWHLPWAMLEGLTHPIYSVWIPSLKIASVLKDIKVARELNPNWSTQERQAAVRQIARKVEARYGEMNYNSMFMNKVAKDIGVATNLSLGWNIGLLDQYVGGAIDLGRAGMEKGGLKSKLASGTLDRPIYAAYYIGTAMAVGGLMHYWFTGKQPESLTDYTHPESGEMDKFGKPIRLNTMFYTREFEGLHKRIEQQGFGDAITDFIANKGAGVASMAISAYRGIDGLGNQIRNENDPAYKQLIQTLSYELADLEPISINALNRSTTNPTKMKVLGGLGFSAAGKYISETPLEGKIETQYNKLVRPKEKAYGQVQMGKDMNELREMYNSDDSKYSDKLDSMAEKYDLDAKDVRRIEKQFASPKEQEFDPSIFMFSKLPDWETQKALLDSMDEETREKYLSHLSKQKRAKYLRETE